MDESTVDAHVMIEARLEKTMNDLACRHSRTQIIAKDKDAEYVECLDCGEILEAGERTERPSADAPEADGSLSDA
jgi:hypothetical protein